MYSWSFEAGFVFNAIPNLNYSLSTSLQEAGHYRDYANSYMNYVPLSKSWKIIES